MKRRRLHESRHPFNIHPFEALCCGSWQDVELIEVRDGAMTMHFADNRHGVEEKGPFANIRIKSRQATLSDCTCFLRPGVDVCVLSSSQETSSLEEENPELVWVDAKISSVERKPHASQCTCQFYVNLYVNQGPLGSERGTLGKDTEVVGINQISVLQKLANNPCESQFYRWDFSEDCSSVQKTKLFLGKFSCDVTWLLVASVLKQFAFDVRLVQNKIIYQILGAYGDDRSLRYNNHLNCVNFKVENSVLTPILVPFLAADCSEVASPWNAPWAEPSLAYDVMKLRRSKRRNVQPERFLGCKITPEMDVGWVRTRPYTPLNWKEESEQENVQLESLFQCEISPEMDIGRVQSMPYEPQKEEEMDLPLSYLFGAHAHESHSQEQSNGETVLCSPKVEPLEYSLVSKPKSKSRKIKLGVANKRKHLIKSAKANCSEHQNDLAIVPVPTGTEPIYFEQLYPTAKTSEKHLRERSSFSCNSKRNSAALMNNFEFEDVVFESKWAGKVSMKNDRIVRHRVIGSKRDGSCVSIPCKKRSLSAGAYNKLINSYMKNIDSVNMLKEEPHIIDQWEEFKAKHRPNQMEKVESSLKEDDEESLETEMLWREMELSMASAYLLEETEVRVSTQATEKSNEFCQHEFKMDEEIGILCQICGVVRTEIKYISATFLESAGWTADYKSCNEEDSEVKLDDEGFDLHGNHVSGEDVSLSEENDNVWDLIPELRMKLHTHQKKAYEFLWRNIAGSMVPEHMEKASKNIGGCVVSHTPGAGKTFLIIAFLVSYLKLFPGKRPLVLAPKTTLYTWYKEFIKWETPIPVHLIHGRISYRVFRQKTLTVRGALKPSHDVMHVLDCLEKIHKWHAQPSILVMGYSSFLILMREDSKFSHRRYMAKVLRESPGILVLDEGHNPRSTKSRLRKVLMKVETDLRILLSGTLFQNNFCEYFNTLCLARPQFIREVLKELDPKFQRKNKVQKARNLSEYRARKFFLDIIARKIDSPVGEERMQGLNMLRKITNGFIDVYEGGASDNLPGLQIYTIMMNSTDIQHEILGKLTETMSTYAGYPLELELLITLASIHPWLIKTSVCVKKFFTSKKLTELEKLKFDFKKGSKVMFVLNLVHRVIMKEKVLMFCHNIAPINLFLDLFENVFKWRRGKEILVLTGDLELFERGKVMDEFEEPGGPSRVLLASITACAEGVSLTAASRVILLDSEWNPSKTKQAIARAFRPGQQKIVYVYQLLAKDTLEQDKYRRTTRKEWLSSMIFSEAFVEDPSKWQAEKIEDDVLREMVEEDRIKSFHMIMKNEKASMG